MPTVYIILYSLYHHVYKVAQAVQKGLEAEGVDVKLFQVTETLSDEILSKLHAPDRPNLPIITVDDLTKADAFMFGIPTRFGTFPSQLKSFLDATGALWATGALAGKFAGTFFSTASQHGGQETTAYTFMTYFAHHGINYVPLGFANSHLFDNSEVIGGSAWGAGTVANGDGSREPTVKELEIATTQGENFAKILTAFHRGSKALDSTTDAADAAAAPAATDAQTDDKIEQVNPSTSGATATAGAVGAAAGATAAANAAGTKDTINKASADANDATATSGTDKAANASKTTTPAANSAKPTETASAQPQSKPAAAAQSKPISEKPAAKQEKKKNDCFCM
ncbi:flavoprotein-like protein [Mycotypha africana]|uniref:flavoprotein-like protein n=1 Tax=Mycotypha africana TaxID=64632 RepID=UPI0023016138|nr:flavoprotein-like protein [Mycotypha africana]KAI8975675.1 flavoprotein-like protein [Mycotypha africana]